VKKPNGQPFNPSERPFVPVSGTWAHSSGVHLAGQCSGLAYHNVPLSQLLLAVLWFHLTISSLNVIPL